jgi:hypothetical protein
MKKFSLIFLAGTLLFSLSSCLKDKNVEDKVYGMNGADEARLVELQSIDASHLKSFAFDFEDKDLTVSIVEVRLTSNELPKSDVTVTLSMANSVNLIDAWNIEEGTSYVQMPINLYTFVGATPLSVVIPAGQRSASVKIVTNPINYDPSSAYALGFEITGVSDPSFKTSANFKTLIVTFGAKNKYDGVYKARGYGNLGTANTTAPYLFSVDCSWDLNLTTAGPNSVYMDAQPLYRGGGVIAYAGIFPKFTFNATTGKVASMQNDAPGNTIAFNYPIDGGTYDSRYDPATKTIYVSFGLNNSSVWRVIDTLEYCRPR